MRNLIKSMGIGLFFFSTALWAQSSGNVVQDIQDGKHGKAFKPEFTVSAKEGGYLEYNCFLQCHSSVKIIEDPKAQAKDFAEGGKYADKRHGITCIVCHDLTVEAPGIKLKRAGWEACTQCHNAEGRGLGQQIHHAQKEMQFGYVLGDITLKPNTHSTVPQMSCTSCHTASATNHTFLAPKNYAEMYDQKLCITCHGDPAAAGKALKVKRDQYKAWIDDLNKEFKPIFNAHETLAAASFKGEKPADWEAFHKDFLSVVAQYRIVQREHSNGVHNFSSAETLLKYSEPIIHAMTKKYPALITQYGTGNRDF